MKIRLFILMAVLGSYAFAPASIPVRISVRAIDQSFDLIPYPEDWVHDSYIDGPAFVRKNSLSWDIVSHSAQTPGRYFRTLDVGDVLAVTFSDGTIRHYTITEEIIMKYKCPGNPFSCAWRVGDTEFTPQTFSEFIMRPGAIVLHTSLAKEGDIFSAGQRVYIAYEK